MRPGDPIGGLNSRPGFGLIAPGGRIVPSGLSEGYASMQDITDLQRRLTGALERIGAGLEALGPGPGAGPDPAQLLADLEAEREMTARLQLAQEGREARVAEVEAELGQARELLAAVEEDRGRLRTLSESLRATCEKLREVNARGVADPELVNHAMGTEIEALRTMRDSDRAELDAILGLLTPVTDAEEARQDA